VSKRVYKPTLALKERTIVTKAERTTIRATTLGADFKVYRPFTMTTIVYSITKQEEIIPGAKRHWQLVVSVIALPIHPLFVISACRWPSLHVVYSSSRHMPSCNVMIDEKPYRQSACEIDLDHVIRH
jgi:hypothetical protein